MTLDELIAKKNEQATPRIVCLCGSTRFSQAFQDANLHETLAGRIVLSIGCNTRNDDDLRRAGVDIDKESLDTLHLFKIDLCHEVLVLNVDGYVGESTRREIEYARRLGKPIRWLHPEHAL